MKYFIFLFILFASTLLTAQEKHALIIAIGNYSEESEWRDINSENDILLLKEALIYKGFKDKNIHIYSGNIDKGSILSSIDKHLIKNVNEGDVCFFHFSGHGQQIADNNKEELDGLDEALVPYDAPMENEFKNSIGETVSYDGKRHLRDDELSVKLLEVRKKLGNKGDIFVSIDACHSGTATRGIGPSRGTMIKNVPKNWTSPKANIESEDKENSRNFGLIQVGDNLATIACFFGSKQDEPNFEYESKEDGKYYGSLSYALSKALMNAESEISYRGLFDKIKFIMSGIAPRQTPQVEGNLDHVIFGGKLLKKVEYYQVKKWENITSFSLDAGTLLGINPGTKIGIYPINTYDYKNVKPLATGTVSYSRYSDSFVILDEGYELKNEDAKNRWYIVQENNYGKMAVSVKLLAEDLSKINMFKDLINGLGYINLVNENADLLLECTSGRKVGSTFKIKLTTSQDFVMIDEDMGFELDSLEINNIIDRIRQYAQTKFLKSLEYINERYLAEVVLVPQVEDPATKNAPPAMKNFIDGDVGSITDQNGAVVIPEGTLVRIGIKNKCAGRIYFALINLTPDYKFSEENLIYPSEGRTDSEFVIEPFQEFKGYEYVINPPCGIDHLVLIVSRNPIPIRSYFDRIARNKTRNISSSFDNVFVSSFKSENELSARNAKTSNLIADDLGMYPKLFEIRKTDSLTAKD